MSLIVDSGAGPPELAQSMSTGELVLLGILAIWLFVLAAPMPTDRNDDPTALEPFVLRLLMCGAALLAGAFYAAADMVATRLAN